MTFLRSPLSIALAAVSMGVVAPAVNGQEVELGPPVPTLKPPGPTRESRVATARSFASTSPLPAPEILPLYGAFQRNFDAHFGLSAVGTDALSEGDFIEEVEKWLAARWGDRFLYTWVERALVVYAQVQASTHFEKKGFNMGVDVDDMAQGKLGVRVSRALE
jgi:hypothetical protein